MVRQGLAVVLGLVALLAGGCRHVAQAPPPSGAPSARVVVTAGFGATPLLDARVSAGRSVMDATRGATPVLSTYGGGFVSGMLGRSSDRGGKRDWFYYLDGVSGRVASNLERLGQGAVAWWDYRPWGGLIDAWAVVGSWPEPFVHGFPGPPTRVAADPPLTDALRAAGAPVEAGSSSWRARVGTDRQLRARDPAWRRAMDDPRRAGLTVAIGRGTIAALDAGGSTYRPVPGGRAVAAAVLTGAQPADGVLLAVAGLDERAALAAARRIARDPGVLRQRYAVVFDGHGRPIAAGGQR